MQPQMLQTIHMMTFERASTEKLHTQMLQTIPATEPQGAPGNAREPHGGGGRDGEDRRLIVMGFGLG